MSTGPDATYEFLSKTENKAANEVLVAGLDCPDRPTRDRALTAIMNRLDPEGHREVFRRLATFDEESRSIILKRSQRLVSVADAALKDPKPKACAAACEAILSFKLYDGFSGLLAVLTDENNPNTELAAKATLKLAQAFYKELSTSANQPRIKDLDNIRSRVTTSLEEGARKFFKHQRAEVVEAFLLVAKQQNATLRQLLRSPEDSSHQVLLEVLSTSQRGGVMRLLLSFLDDPQMPLPIVRLLTGRCDRKFVTHLLGKVNPKSTSKSRTYVETLSRFESVAWAKPGHELLESLDDRGQDAAVRLLMATSIERDELLDTIEYLLLHGTPGGRRAAAKALAEFDGSRADTLAIRAINDKDPEVRAHLIRQLRPREIPGAMSLLIRMVDSSQEIICEALREAMPEFSFRQFMVTFDSLPEKSQLIGGHLVRQIDPDAASLLAAEMGVLSPVRRRRAVSAAVAMGLSRELEEALIPLVSDSDHMVRAVAAEALSQSESVVTWEALRDALLDRSVIVQEAAEQSLMQISQTLMASLRKEQEEAAEAEGAQQDAEQEEITP